MRTPTPAELLDLWDAASLLIPSERPLLLLRAVADGHGDPAQLSLGERDRLLLELRERLFGSTLGAVEHCPACELPLEVGLPTSALLSAPKPREVVEVRAEGTTVTCRPLRAGDLADAAATEALDVARELLIERSILSAERDGQPVDASQLTAGVVEAVASALSEADALADVELPLTCDACGAAWVTGLDIASYLWQELDAWAARITVDVDVLARAYRWSEREILSLSPRRRRRYLELAIDG
jgi:hypothetical protein